MQAADGGKITIGDNLKVKISGSDSGDENTPTIAALQAQGNGDLVSEIVVGDNTNIETTGENSYGIWAYKAEISTGANLNLVASGINSRGILAHEQGTINLDDNTYIETKGAEAIAVKAAYASSVINFNGAEATIKSKGGNDATGDFAYALYADGGKINLSPAFDVLIDLANDKDSVIALNGGQITNRAISEVNLQGRFISSGAGSLIDFKMYDGSTIVGAGVRDNGGDINLKMQNSQWALTDSSSVTNLDIAGTVVDMSYTGVGQYENFEVDNLSSKNTTYIMNTNLASETDSDKIIINNTATADKNYISVNDTSLTTGNEVTGAKKLLLVEDKSETSEFEGKELDTGGLWDTIPTVEKIGNDWYLTKLARKANPSTSDVIGTFESGYGLWRSTILDDTLRKRLGDLRYKGAEDSGLWTRVKAGKLAGKKYDSSYQMYQVGMDKKAGNSIYGFAVDHSTNNNTLTSGVGEGSNTGLSLYATNYHDSGAYSDVVLRAGKLRTDMHSNGTFKDSFDYDAWSYSASYEVGKTFRKENGWFVEPQAQLVYGHLAGGDYTTDRGVSVNRDSINSFIGRLGFVLGRQINKNADYYFKANVYREFGGSGDLNLVYGSQKMNYDGDHKDTWFEMGIGTNVKLNNNTYFYGDVLKTFGADIQKKWQVNVGLRWTWGGAKKHAPVIVPVVEPTTVAPAPVKETYLDSVHFDFDVDTLIAGEMYKIDHFAEVAKEHPDKKYAVVGNTDAIGTDEYNMDLSKRRADNVKAEAAKRGVPDAQMQETYLGKAKPADTNETSQGRAANRRVEIYEHEIVR